jgi:hypothetical protein
VQRVPIARRFVIKRLVTPWESRHPYAVAGVRFAAGGFTLGLGLVLLSLGQRAETRRERRKMYRLAAWFLGQAALLFAGGSLDMTVARSAPPRP